MSATAPSYAPIRRRSSSGEAADESQRRVRDLDHYALQIRQAVQSGVLVGSAGPGRVASATRADYAAAAVAVLTGDGHQNKTYELGGDVAWNYAELADVLTKATGQQVTYRAVSAAEHHELLVAAGIPGIVADLFINTYTGIANGELADTTGQLSALIGRPTTPWPTRSPPSWTAESRPPVTR